MRCSSLLLSSCVTMLCCQPPVIAQVETTPQSKPAIAQVETTTQSTQSTQSKPPEVASPEIITVPETSNRILQTLDKPNHLLDQPHSAELLQPAPQPQSDPAIKIENLTVDFRNESDSGKTNRFIEPTAQFQLRNGDKIRFTTGVDTFQQSGIDTITNIPVYVGWDHKIGESTLKLGGGIDTFNRLSAVPKVNAQIDLPVGLRSDAEGRLVRGAIFSTLVDYGAHKFNAKTLQNGINVVQVKPSVYWQIDRDTSFYGHYLFGFYNDGNFEQQTVSRLERKLGSFYVAANLFTWSYNKDKESTSGYFSPQDFLTYNGEIGWEGKVFSGVKCRISGKLGQQRLDSQFSNATSFHTGCGIPISPNLNLNVGYDLTNVRNRSNGSNYQGQTVSGQLQYSF